MAYSTYSDVTKEFKNIVFSSNSSVTSDDVTEFITQADAYIDSQIASKYITPITGAESLKVLKRLSIWLVAGRIKMILKVKSGQDIGDQGNDSDLITMARDEIKDIVKGLVKLTDATLAITGSGMKSYANDENLEYTFKKGDDQW